MNKIIVDSPEAAHSSYLSADTEQDSAPTEVAQAGLDEEPETYDARVERDTRQLEQMIPDLLRVFQTEDVAAAQAMVADFVYFVREHRSDFLADEQRVMDEMQNFFPNRQSTVVDDVGVFSVRAATNGQYCHSSLNTNRRFPN